MINFMQAYVDKNLKGKVTLTVNNAGTDAQKQIAAISDMISDKVDAILINPVSDAALNGVMEEAAKQGIMVMAFDQPVTAPSAYNVAVNYVRLGEIHAEWIAKTLAASDVVSLHCPLNDETRNMIDAAALQRMRREAILINTARGGLVDVAALIDAIRDETIAGAGIDVLPVEPPRPDDPLAIAYRSRAESMVGDRLIVTPHAAWSSPESVGDARRLAVETAMLYLREGRLRNLVNAPAAAPLFGAA